MVLIIAHILLNEITADLGNKSVIFLLKDLFHSSADGLFVKLQVHFYCLK